MDEAESEKPNSSVDFAAVLDPWGFCTRIKIDLRWVGSGTKTKILE
jgi:hypothetical protein